MKTRLPQLHPTPGGRTAPLALGLVFALAAGLVTAQSADDPAGALFEDVSASAGIDAAHRAVWDPADTRRGYLAVGQAWGDYDDDGWLDLFVTGNQAPNVLYRNNGDGTFAVSPLGERVAAPGSVSGGAVWADFDNDGWRDLYVLNHGPNQLFRNEGGRGFSDVTEQAGVGDAGKGTSAAWSDYDGDSDLDLYVVNWSCLPECDPEIVEASRDRLYRNDGDGTFTDVTDALLADKTVGAGFAASFFDFDDDGDADLFVVNDKMANPIGNVLWRNDGPGCRHWCWTEVSREAGASAVIHGMGVAVGDYDNDLHQDLFVSNMMSPMLLLDNGGDGVFSDVTQRAGVGVNPPGNASGWGSAFFDYDNDGWLDLFLAATGLPPGPGGFYGGQSADMEDFRNPYPDALFHNNGDGTFSEVGEGGLPAPARPSMGLAYADYDNDGWVDVVQGHWNEGYALYRNLGAAGAGNGWLTVRLRGAGPVNRDAVGARVLLTLDDGSTRMQEVICGSSLGAGNDTALHFGLGDAGVAELTVVWPNGEEQRLDAVPSDQMVEIAYEAGG